MSRLRGGHLCAPGDPPARHAPAGRRHRSLQEEESDQREGATHQVTRGILTHVQNAFLLLFE